MCKRGLQGCARNNRQPVGSRQIQIEGRQASHRRLVGGGVVAIKGVGTSTDEDDVVKVRLQSLGSLEKKAVERCFNQSHRHSLKKGASTRS